MKAQSKHYLRLLGQENILIFSSEIEISPISREVWIFGQGNVEWQPAGNDSMTPVWTVDNANSGSIFVTAKQISKIGTGTTVSRIIVWGLDYDYYSQCKYNNWSCCWPCQ